MTGSPIQNGLRRICQNSTAALRSEYIAGCEKHSKRVVSQCQFNFREQKKPTIEKNMYFSDDSDPYETTCSQDERITQKLQEEKEKEISEEKAKQEERKRLFEEMFREKSDVVFELQGLTFLKFTHEKIKFSFEPGKLTEHVKKSVIFYCSLKYRERYEYWAIRKDSFPMNYKQLIYPFFYGKNHRVTDGNVTYAICKIYKKLTEWVEEEAEFRLEKFKRYQNGEDIVLDSDDEELFLTKEQRRELQHKRHAILKRMIPPPDDKTRQLPPEPGKRKKIVELIAAEGQKKKSSKKKILLEARTRKRHAVDEENRKILHRKKLPQESGQRKRQGESSSTDDQTPKRYPEPAQRNTEESTSTEEHIPKRNIKKVPQLARKRKQELPEIEEQKPKQYRKKLPRKRKVFAELSSNDEQERKLRPRKQKFHSTADKENLTKHLC